MPTMWWILTMSCAVACGAAGAWLAYVRAVHTREDWAAAGLRYGEVWPSTVSNAVLFGLVGFTLGNFVGQWWL